MTGRDIMLLVFTFATGVFAGLYIYVTAYQPTYENTETLADSEVKAAEFSIIGERYGGGRGRDQQPSFRLLGDGTYTYFVGANQREGSVPGSLLRDVKAVVAETDLRAAEVVATATDCRSFVDGLDARYRFTIDSRLYAIDTCTSSVDYEDDIVRILEAVWDYLQDPAGGYQSQTEAASVSGWFEAWLQEQFDWREQSDQ